MSKILLVDDEPNIRTILKSNLLAEKYAIHEAANVAQARAKLLETRFDAVITDQKMPDGDGLQVLAAAHELDPTLAVVFLTAFATVELAVQSMRGGAFDFLTKPFQPGVVRAVARRACEHTALVRENGVLREAIDRLEGATDLFGNSHAMIGVREKIARVAPTNATILITGETGTGKELVAREIHKSSVRASKPFIAVNCAAFTDTLLESELFGHEKGAFTGADRLRQGLFETAHEGTLFLDEAGEMSPAAQAKLLRVLTEGQIVRVGSNRPREVDVRVLVATHRDLQARVRDGLFREDLFYRINVVPIAIPPLRERREDLPGLCAVFCRDVSRELKVPFRPLGQTALEKLKRYHFPGNVRELRNLVERALILANGPQLDADDFPVAVEASVSSDDQHSPRQELDWIAALPGTLDLRQFLEQVERQLILRALHTGGGVQAEAARRLELSRSDLAYKMTKYQIRATPTGTDQSRSAEPAAADAP